ncbi:MAG TPA: SGNH/GDSL hydrolase family protein [Rectinemataceae bacterium]|nr:SGNH/GDSL hydrolase family protein [Rectinemataceae bacterium]
MKTILCFGDSNTWGYDPEAGSRFPLERRWPSVMASRLGPGYLAIAEGLGGRTTVWDDPVEVDKNGARHLPSCLESHKPLDLVIIMLGTNDLKLRFGAGPLDIASGAQRLARMVLASGTGPVGAAPAVLLVGPPPILEVGPLAEMFAGGAAKSARLAQFFTIKAEELGLPLLLAGDYLASSPLDGIHFSAEGQRALGEAIAAWVARALPGR